MAGNIKGITIEFRGDTTRLDKALRQVNTETRKIDQELKKVDKALKFNPTSVELWRQKQQLLTQKVSETNEKLKLLKDAQAQMDADGVDKNSEEYRKLQREIIETQSKLKTFNTQLKKIGNVKLQALSEQFKHVGANLEKAGQSMKGLSIAGGVVAGSIGVLAYKAGDAADELNTLSKVTGIGTGQLQMYGAAANLVDVSVDAIAKSNARLKKNMMSASQGSKSQVAAFESLGVSVTNADGSLRDSDAVFQDVLSALGSMTNETERDALAMTLMGKSASELNPLIEDGGETYKNLADTLAKYDLNLIDQEDLNAANDFNDSLDTMKAIGTVALQSVGTQLASYLAPALEKVVDWVGKLAQWISNLSPQTLTVIGIIGSVIAVMAPLLITIGKIATGIGAVMKVASGLGSAFTLLTGPVGIVIAIIGALIAVGVLLYKNWDTIKAKVKALKDSLVKIWEGIKKAVFEKVRSLYQDAVAKFGMLKSKATTIWNNIKDAITKPIQAAKDKVKGIIDKIKGFFPFKIGKIMSNLKLPHFKLTGEFSLKNKTVPHLSVDWYKRGGIFDSPSIIGVGEAGSEAVVPLDKFWKKLDQMQGGNNININVYGAEGQSAKEIAEEVRKMLIKETKQRRLAWQ